MRSSRVEENKRFNIKGRVAVITGAAGLLGVEHSQAIAEIGGIPVLWDINLGNAQKQAAIIKKKFGVAAIAMQVDITQVQQISDATKKILSKLGRVDILINNAAYDPKVGGKDKDALNRFEDFSVDVWDKHLLVGLTGSFLCSQIIGTHMATCKGGVIINISSDLGLIAPDQRIYRKKNVHLKKQPVKPVTYSVVKHGLIGLTKYLATYWAEDNVRVNAICPGGVFVNQPQEFVEKLTNLIPMGRMARLDEYRGAIQFLASEASSYMTGSTLTIDGGRTAW